jgi:hypothetical protein
MERWENDDEQRKLDQDALMGQLGQESALPPLGRGFADLASAMKTPQAFAKPSETVEPMRESAFPQTMLGGTTTNGGNTGGVSGTMPIGDAKSPIPAAAPTAPTASVFQGFTPKHAMEGFAFDREQNTGKSAKDAFAYLANQAPPPPIHDKAALGAWFKQYIEPGMNQLGHKVSSVDGDKFRYSNHEGEFDVDFGRGAGAEGGALAWQVDPGTAKMGNGVYTPQAGPQGGQQVGSVITPTTDQGQTAQDEIAAEIETLISGGNSRMDERALMQLLSEAQI